MPIITDLNFPRGRWQGKNLLSLFYGYLEEEYYDKESKYAKKIRMKSAFYSKFG